MRIYPHRAHNKFMCSMVAKQPNVKLSRFHQEFSTKKQLKNLK